MMPQRTLPARLRAADWSGTAPAAIEWEEGQTTAKALVYEAAAEIERGEKIAAFLNEEIARLNAERDGAAQQAAKIIHALGAAINLTDHLLDFIPPDTAVPYDIMKAKQALDTFMTEILAKMRLEVQQAQKD